MTAKTELKIRYPPKSGLCWRASEKVTPQRLQRSLHKNIYEDVCFKSSRRKPGSGSPGEDMVVN